VYVVALLEFFYTYMEEAKGFTSRVLTTEWLSTLDANGVNLGLKTNVRCSYSYIPMCQPSGISINQNVLPYRHNHVTLLIWNALDTPLSVYRPLKPHSIGTNLLSPLLRSNTMPPLDTIMRSLTIRCTSCLISMELAPGQLSI
jgi:hypothetical protein